MHPVCIPFRRRRSGRQRTLKAPVDTGRCGANTNTPKKQHRATEVNEMDTQFCRRRSQRWLPPTSSQLTQLLCRGSLCLFVARHPVLRTSECPCPWSRQSTTCLRYVIHLCPFIHLPYSQSAVVGHGPKIPHGIFQRNNPYAFNVITP